MPSFTLELLQDHLSVYRFPSPTADSAVARKPDPILDFAAGLFRASCERQVFCSLTRTHDEISIVCPSKLLDDHLALMRHRPAAPPTAVPVTTAAAASNDQAQPELPDPRAESDWRAFKIQGPLDFALVGVLSQISAVLAQAGVSIFAVSTFDTDYILVKQDRLDDARAALEAMGCSIQP
ncbi:ACT domain-containing protein [Polychytrium aggregatum]|uniref:ACT domain-containing protein n=1 Tax=Polychytrium aggregatum TaxID=110093 RepID=UPI0022FDF285|nr:ACT domain-containing protein [Polychytrium aggregatum]KAI9204334.1 ACT domain-containing protein [Polychytrium aggregatum]